MCHIYMSHVSYYEFSNTWAATKYSYDFPKIQFCLMQISDKIESLENHNWRTGHSTNLVQCLFSSLSNSLESRFFFFFLTSFRGFIWYVSIFRLFSYFVWLEWRCVVGRWIRLKIGNNVIEKKYMVPLKKVELTLT